MLVRVRNILFDSDLFFGAEECTEDYIRPDHYRGGDKVIWKAPYVRIELKSWDPDSLRSGDGKYFQRKFVIQECSLEDFERELKEAMQRATSSDYERLGRLLMEFVRSDEK